MSDEPDAPAEEPSVPEPPSPYWVGEALDAEMAP